MSNVAVLAEISLRTPRKLFIFVIKKKNVDRIEVSKKIYQKKTLLMLSVAGSGPPMWMILRSVFNAQLPVVVRCICTVRISGFKKYTSVYRKS